MPGFFSVTEGEREGENEQYGAMNSCCSRSWPRNKNHMCYERSTSSTSYWSKDSFYPSDLPSMCLSYFLYLEVSCFFLNRCITLLFQGQGHILLSPLPFFSVRSLFLVHSPLHTTLSRDLWVPTFLEKAYTFLALFCRLSLFPCVYSYATFENPGTHGHPLFLFSQLSHTLALRTLNSCLFSVFTDGGRPRLGQS